MPSRSHPEHSPGPAARPFPVGTACATPWRPAWRRRAARCTWRRRDGRRADPGQGGRPGPGPATPRRPSTNGSKWPSAPCTRPRGWALGELEAGRPITPPARCRWAREPGRRGGEPGTGGQGVTGETRIKEYEEMTHVRALLSVYDKEGLVELAQGLSELGWELVASGNTAAALAGPGSPTSRWPRSPDPPKCWAAGSRPCTPRSTGGSWPTGTSRATWPTWRPRGSTPIDLVV